MSLLDEIKAENPIEEKILEVLRFYDNNKYLRLYPFSEKQYHYNKSGYNVIKQLYHFGWNYYKESESRRNFILSFKETIIREVMQLETLKREYESYQLMNEVDLSSHNNVKEIEVEKLETTKQKLLEGEYKMNLIKHILLPHQLETLNKYVELVKNMSTLKLRLETDKSSDYQTFMEMNNMPWIEPVINLCDCTSKRDTCKVKTFITKVYEKYNDDIV